MARRADLLHGGVLALGPGSLVRDDDGALAGTAVSSGFRRGVVETVVDVDGVGEVTVVEPSGAFLSVASALPGPGDRLRLRPDPAAIAVVPALLPPRHCGSGRSWWRLGTTAGETGDTGNVAGAWILVRSSAETRTTSCGTRSGPRRAATGVTGRPAAARSTRSPSPSQGAELRTCARGPRRGRWARPRRAR